MDSRRCSVFNFRRSISRTYGDSALHVIFPKRPGTNRALDLALPPVFVGLVRLDERLWLLLEAGRSRSAGSEAKGGPKGSRKGDAAVLVQSGESR